ncbi:MAG: DsbA family oxidoreductase [Alphaproteobacteria bacterium]|nr:DsbA family oxidoreductase [Alphaproteobacteria bacterium]
MQIDIFSDPICPWCYIGKRRLERALAARSDLRPEIRWRAFQLNPAMPEDGMDRNSYLSAKFGSAAEAQRLYGQISQVGMTEGINFRFNDIAVTPNTINAHRLIRHAAQAGRQDTVVEALFRGYFLEGRNIGDNGILVDIATESGMEPEPTRLYLESADDAALIREEDMRGRQMGIEGVPYYIVNRGYALSGAHEPEAFYSLFDMVNEQSREAAASD